VTRAGDPREDQALDTVGVCLQRVRSEVMSMETADDIEGVIAVMKEELVGHWDGRRLGCRL
jgi:hypothetical protein